jgi:hypothetical protein
MIKARKGLYYTKGGTPTKEEATEAQSLGIVCFRNARLVPEDAPSVEPTDLVAGLVPLQYRRIQGQRIAGKKTQQA